MTMPFYVPAEQMMKDKADFARKNIARGKALVALYYADGILIAAENTSATLRKVSEIYDRIAFAGAGKYNEYDRLRIAGVRRGPQGLLVQPRGRRRPEPRQRLRPDAGRRVHPRDQAHGGRDRGGRAGHRPGQRRAVPHLLRRHGGRRGGLHRPGRGRGRGHHRAGRQSYEPGRPWTRR